MAPVPPQTLPEMPTIRATQTASPPGWALLERRLMDLMEKGTETVIRKHSERGGVTMYADDVDDLYERI